MKPETKAPGRLGADPGAHSSTSTVPAKNTTGRPFSEFQLRVLSFLAGDWRSAWDAARELNTCALRSAISSLRSKGVQIEVRRSWFTGQHGGRVHHSLYRLAPGELQKAVERQRNALAGR